MLLVIKEAKCVDIIVQLEFLIGKTETLDPYEMTLALLNVAD